MWFKQNEQQKSPQQPEAATPQPPPAPVAPTHTAPPAAPATPAPAAREPLAAPVPAPSGSRITPGLVVKGEISGREDLWIGGNVDGTVRFDSARIVVGGSGKFHGQMESREIVVEGNVDGDLLASERLEITSSGTARGDASAPRVSIQEGAIFNGSIEVVRAGESRAAQQPPSASRNAPTPRGTSRPQTTQAAGAAAGAGAPTASAGTTATVTASVAEGGNGEGTVIARGIAADPAKSE